MGGVEQEILRLLLDVAPEGMVSILASVPVLL